MKTIILGVSGSLGRDSATRGALDAALVGASRKGAEVRVVDLRDIDLPFCDGRPSDAYPASVQAWRLAVRDADGIIFASPEYHNSLTGSLKNAIDLLDREDMRGTMCGIVGVAGGSQGAGHTVSALRTILRAFGAWVVPLQVSIANAAQAVAPDGSVADQTIRERLEQLGEEVAHFAGLHARHAG